jgi:hypothetical protein
MVAATRFEIKQTIPVLICWDCGIEDPPLYAALARRQNIVLRCRCDWCWTVFTQVLPLHGTRARACSLECADRLANAAHRRATRRPAS